MPDHGIIRGTEHGGVRWDTLPKRALAFTQLVAGDIEEIFTSKKHVVKENSARAIACVRGAGGEGYFVKKYNRRGIAGFLRGKFGKSQARREWRNLLEAKEKNLPVPEPVAFGAASEFEYLATIEIPDAEPLIENLRARGSVPREEVTQLAEITAAMHEAGLVHRDLHLGNFLVSPGRDGLVLMDFHRARFRKNADRAAVAADLGQMLYSLSLVGTDENCGQMLNEYVKIRGLAQSGLEDASLVEARLWGDRHERSRAKRCLRNSSRFTVESKGGRRIFCRKDFDIDLDKLIEEHRGIVKRGGDGLLKDSPKSKLTVHDSPGGGRLVVKRHGGAGLSRLLEICTRGSRLGREWVNANGLLARGFKTPTPVALVEVGPPWNRTSFLVSEFLRDARPLDEYLREKFAGEPTTFSRGDKADTICSLAGLIRRLHEKKIFHKDMKANNILVREEENGPSFFFLDLDRVRFDVGPALGEIAAALAALNAAVPNFITLSDRMLFYRTYRGVERLDGGEKSIVREIVRRSIERNHFWRPKC